MKVDYGINIAEIQIHSNIAEIQIHPSRTTAIDCAIFTLVSTRRIMWRKSWSLKVSLLNWEQKITGVSDLLGVLVPARAGLVFAAARMILARPWRFFYTTSGHCQGQKEGTLLQGEWNPSSWVREWLGNVGSEQLHVNCLFIFGIILWNCSCYCSFSFLTVVSSKLCLSQPVIFTFCFSNCLLWPVAGWRQGESQKAVHCFSGNW